MPFAASVGNSLGSCVVEFVTNSADEVTRVVVSNSTGQTIRVDIDSGTGWVHNRTLGASEGMSQNVPNNRRFPYSSFNWSLRLVLVPL